MTRFLLLLCTALMICAVLCSCMRNTMDEVGDEVSTMMTEMIQDIKDAADNGTTADKDGFIGNDDGSEAESTVKDETDGIFLDDDESNNLADETREYVSGTEDNYM